VPVVVALGVAIAGCGKGFEFSGGGQGGETATGGSGGTSTSGSGGTSTSGTGGAGAQGAGGSTSGTAGAGGIAPCRGLSFDGSHDFVQVPDHGALDGMGQLTVEAWIFVSGTAAAAILSHHQEGQALGGYVFEHKNNKALTFRMFAGGQSYGEGGSVLSQITEEIWVHVASVFDGSEIRLYVGGELKDSGPQPLPGGGIGDYAGPLRIGANVATDDRYFDGLIDEVRISDVPRYTGAQFNPPTGPFLVDGSTVALWHFDEGEGQTAADATGTHHGTLGASQATELSDPMWIEVPCIGEMNPG